MNYKHWYDFWDWLDKTWEAWRMNILLCVGVIIAVFMAVSIIAGIARHRDRRYA